MSFSRSSSLKVSLSPSKGVSSESLLYLCRLFKNQNKNAINPTRAKPPITPPTTGPGETRAFDVLSEADASAGSIKLEVALGEMELLVSVTNEGPFSLLKGPGSTVPNSFGGLEVEIDMAEPVGVATCGIDKGVVSSAEDVALVMARTEVLDDSCVT
jgi:hypothetical protein